jgi:signal transduction histidine kinase
MFRLDAAQSFFDVNRDAAKEQLGWAKKAVEGTQAGLRSVLWDLQEESEGPESLLGLLRYAVGRMPHWAGKVSVESTGVEPEMARSLGGRFLMIVQEAVGNALVRGRAEHVRIRLFFRHGLVRLAISDDGCGFSVADAPGVKDGHLGLSSMSARAHELGGTFVVKSESGKGTVVIVEIPV